MSEDFLEVMREAEKVAEEFQDRINIVGEGLERVSAVAADFLYEVNIQLCGDGQISKDTLLPGSGRTFKSVADQLHDEIVEILRHYRFACYSLEP